MAFYLYVPNSNGQSGTVLGAFEALDDARVEQALHSHAQIIEGPKPSYRHLYAYLKNGWKKCEACGRPTPPWRLDGAGPKPVEVASEVEGGK